MVNDSGERPLEDSAGDEDDRGGKSERTAKAADEQTDRSGQVGDPDLENEVDQDAVQDPPRGARKPSGSPPDRLLGSITDGLVKVVGAFFTTAGFLTFIAATGAAVTWVRFWSAQLPADQAIQVVPRETLIAAGAVALALFTVLGLVAVAGVYAIDSAGRAIDGMRPGLFLLVAAEVVLAILLAVEDGLTKAVAITISIVIGALGIVTTYYPKGPGGGDVDNRLTSARKGLHRVMQKVGLGAFATKRQRVPPTQAEVEEASRLHELRLRESAVPKPRYRRELTPGALFLGLLTALATALAFLGLFGEDEYVGASVLVASGLAGICFGVARTSGDKFWPYGLAVFFSVALFGAFVSTARLYDLPQANPVALLRTGDSRVSGLTGLLVARADDRYWLATIELDCKDGEATATAMKDSGRIFSIPQSQVLDDEIGAPADLKTAGEQAPQLLRELIRRQPPGGTPRKRRTRGSKARVAKVTKVHAPPAIDPCTCARPHLERLSPTRVAPRDAVTLRGENLGRGGRVLRVGGRSASIDRSSSTRIGFRAPRQPGTYAVRVRRCRRSNRLRLTVEDDIKRIALSAQNFQFRKHGLNERGRQAVGRLRGRLQGQVDRIDFIRVTGHADYAGGPALNRRLSKRRARAVRNLLIANGALQKNLLRTRGLGESQAKGSNREDPRRRDDRRTDVKVFYK